MKRNYVAAGDYVNQDVIVTGRKFYFMRGLKKVGFEKPDVAKYELVDKDSEILLSVEFTDGKKSLLSLDRQTYKNLITLIF